jgi:hypothetical protein
MGACTTMRCIGGLSGVSSSRHRVELCLSGCRLLEELLEPYPDVRIVLSTSWVRVKSFEFAKKHLTPALQSRVVGATYHRREMHGQGFERLSRGLQVWGDVIRRKPTNWFAIDNDDRGWPTCCRDKLAKAEDHLGISDPRLHVRRATRARQVQ